MLLLNCISKVRSIFIPLITSSLQLPPSPHDSCIYSLCSQHSDNFFILLTLRTNPRAGGCGMVPCLTLNLCPGPGTSIMVFTDMVYPHTGCYITNNRKLKVQKQVETWFFACFFFLLLIFRIIIFKVKYCIIMCSFYFHCFVSQNSINCA